MVWLYKVAKNHCLMNRRKSKLAPKEELSLEELMPDRKRIARSIGQSQWDTGDFVAASRERKAPA